VNTPDGYKRRRLYIYLDEPEERVVRVVNYTTGEVFEGKVRAVVPMASWAIANGDKVQFESLLQERTP
jgi:hypothetical protein